MPSETLFVDCLPGKGRPLKEDLWASSQFPRFAVQVLVRTGGRNELQRSYTLKSYKFAAS